MERASARPSPHSTTVIGVLDVGVEVEVVELGGVAEAVGVDVHERGLVGGQRGVDAGDHEGGRGDVAAYAEPLADALGHRGLAGAEVAGEDHQVAGPQERGQPAAEGVRVVGGAQDPGDREEPQHGQAVAVAARLDVPLPTPEVHRLRQLHAGLELDAAEVAGGGDLARPRGHLRGDAEATHRGEYADPAEPEQPAARFEEQRADGTALVLDQQATVRVERLADGLLGLVERRRRAGRGRAGRRRLRVRRTARRPRAGRRRS